MLGVATAIRSDGITIRQDPLIPGHVFDGPFFGKDINYQLSTNSLYASWMGFGGGGESQTIDHTGKQQ